MALKAVPDTKYTIKTFDSSKYVVEGYQYPSDLLGNQWSGDGNVSTADTSLNYGGNYVVFYINVNNEARMLRNPDGSSIDPDTQLLNTVEIDPSERTKKALAGKAYSQKEVVAAQTVSGTVAGTAAGSVIDAGGIGGVAGGVIGFLGSEAIAMNTQNSTFSRPQKRLKTAIALHVPNQLSIRYGAGWSEDDTFGLQALIEGGEAAGRAMLEAGKALANTKDAEGAKQKALSEVKGISSIVANVALAKGPGGAALSAMTGLAPNPMKEQIFKGVDFRSFTMEYQFAPRNEKESKNVLNIIHAFKYHMHPEYKDSKNFLFLYPSEFDIVYFHNGKENMNIHRHTSCVLTELNVNYTPNGNFSTFTGGMPTQINVSMTFKELTILTKELIQEGL